METPLSPMFDPANAGHKTHAEWSLFAPFPWWGNAILHAMRHGESRVLLPDGRVVRYAFDSAGVLREEVL